MAKSGLPIAITVVVAILIAGYLAVQLRAERHSVAQLQEHAAALELAQAKTAASTVPPAAIPAPETPAPAAEMPAGKPAEDPSPVPAKSAATQQIVVMRPDGTRDTDPTAAARFQVRFFWGDIEKDLGFSAEEVEALVQLLARGNATPAEFDAVTGGRYVQLQERQWAGLAENRVTSLRSSLSSTAHPLTDQQQERLRAAFTTEFRRTDGENSNQTRPTDPRTLLDLEEQRSRATEASDERLVAAARSFLNADQVAVMQSSLDRMANARRRNLETRRLQIEAGGSGAANPAPIYVYPAAPAPAPR